MWFVRLFLKSKVQKIMQNALDSSLSLRCIILLIFTNYLSKQQRVQVYLKVYCTPLLFLRALSNSFALNKNTKNIIFGTSKQSLRMRVRPKLFVQTKNFAFGRNKQKFGRQAKICLSYKKTSPKARNFCPLM